MIANVNDGPAEVDLRVDLARFGLTGPVEVSNEVDGSVLPVSDGVIRRIAVRRHANRCLLLAAPGVFDTGPARDITRLNTGKRITELCDDFSTLSPAWEASFNPQPTYFLGAGRKPIGLTSHGPQFLYITQLYRKCHHARDCGAMACCEGGLVEKRGGGPGHMVDRRLGGYGENA
jgi:hypothetical protein